MSRTARFVTWARSAPVDLKPSRAVLFGVCALVNAGPVGALAAGAMAGILSAWLAFRAAWHSDTGGESGRCWQADAAADDLSLFEARELESEQFSASQVG